MEAVNFALGIGNNIDFLADTMTDDWLATIDMGQLHEIQASNVLSPLEIQKLDKILHQPEPEDELPPPETPAMPVAIRFKTVFSKEIIKYEQMHQSDATKRNTQWGVKNFQGTQYLSTSLLWTFRITMSGLNRDKAQFAKK